MAGYRAFCKDRFGQNGWELSFIYMWESSKKELGAMELCLGMDKAS